MNTFSRHRLTRLIVVLIVGLSLIWILFWMLNGGNIATAWASMLSGSAFAPLPTSTYPTSNALNVPISSNVSITFDNLISPTSITSRTFAIYGSQSPIFTGTYSLVNFSRTVVLDPVRAFFAGERMDATVTTATLNITGEQSIASVVWQFWATAGGGSGSFAGRNLGANGSESTDLALGDLDNDGDLDAIVSGYTGQPDAVWLNEGTGTFTIAQTLGDAHNWTVALGDVDGDGDLDACVGNFNQVGRVWLNNGTGILTDSNQSLADFITDIALGDMDGDGDLDMFVTRYYGLFEGPSEVWLNNGSGLFTDSGQRLGSFFSQGVALGDVDGDGDLDAFVANSYNGDTSRIWLNDGIARFTDSGQQLNCSSCWGQAVALGDLDSDGDLDAFIANSGGNVPQPDAVWLNSGNGTFADSGQQLGTEWGYDVALGDLDSDGDLDAFVANSGSEGGAPNKVWLNDGYGIFVDSGQSLGNSHSWGVALGDVDSDSDLDALVGNRGEANEAWYNLQNRVYLPLIVRLH